LVTEFRNSGLNLETMKNGRLLPMLFVACWLPGLEASGEGVPPAPLVGFGPDPVLPEPQHKLIPTVKIAPAVGWKNGATPIAATGLKVKALVVGLDHPRWLYQGGETEITAPGTMVVDLPAGPINHHWTKNIIANRDGSLLYTTVGSNSNVGENGLDKEVGRAAILEINPATGTSRVYASGLRYPIGLGSQPQSGALWAVVNERDELGNDLVPDYLTSVKDGAFYGRPFCYYGQHVDDRVKEKHPDLVAKAIAPDYALGNHTAPLGLAFCEGNLLPPHYAGGAFVGQHGSWNRKPAAGYKVIFVPFVAGRPAGMPEDVLTGFHDAEGNAQGRPVGVAIDRSGALLIADDVGNIVWRVTPTTATDGRN